MDGFFNQIEAWLRTYGPNILGALAILVVGYFLALLAQWALRNAIDRVAFVKGANESEPAKPSVGSSFGAAGFWLVMLAAIVLALEAAGMTTISDSVRGTVDQIFRYLPRVVGAIFTFFVFLIVARVARQASLATLNAVGADTVTQRLGLTTAEVRITKPLGAIIFALIIIPGAIAALEVLDIDAITGPAVAMLNDVLGALPNIIVAAIIIALFAMIAQFVRDLAMRILPNTGIDRAVGRLGVLSEADRGVTASTVIAQALGFFILLLGLIQGMKTLGFAPLTEALNVVLALAVQILFGSVIVFAGVLISGVIARAMKSATGGPGDFVAELVRYVIIILAAILGISRMGLDPSGEFVTNAAQIILVGAALAGGIAFGLGGKDWAARQLAKLDRGPGV